METIYQMDTYEETIQRIEKAYLSSKNVDSVYENLLYEMGNENIDGRIYTPQFLRNYIKQMMVYLCHQFKPRLKSDNFVSDPKKTIILMNAVAIRKVLQQVKEQIQSLPKVGLTSFPETSVVPDMSQRFSRFPVHFPRPMLSNDAFRFPFQQFAFHRQPSFHQPVSQSYFPQQQQSCSFPSSSFRPVYASQPQKLSTPVDDLLPKKKRKHAVSIKRLDKYISKAGMDQHQWWLQAKKEQDFQRKTQHCAQPGEISYLTTQPLQPLQPLQSPYPQLQPLQSPYPQQLQQQPQYPWKLITVSSADRDTLTWKENCQYVLPISLDNVVSMYLYSVDIPVEGKVVDGSNNLLYYSEDDDPMKIITLPEPDESVKDSTQYLYDYLQDIADEMTKRSEKYRYRITLNRHTNRIRMMQILESGQFRNTLHLFFEQTRNNCCQLLGFEPRDYRDGSEYEGSTEHGFRHLDKRVHMMIQEISADPILTLKVGMGLQRKQQQFPHSCIWHNEEETFSTRQLSISFVNDEGEIAWLSSEDHEIMLKYYYVPNLRITDQENESSLKNSSKEENENLATIGKWNGISNEPYQQHEIEKNPHQSLETSLHIPQVPQGPQQRHPSSLGTTDSGVQSVGSEETCGKQVQMPRDTPWVPQKRTSRLPTLDI